MRTLSCIFAALLLAASCSTPMPSITTRPDQNVMTSGTGGSVNATNGPTTQTLADKIIRDSILRAEDTTIVH